MRRLVVVAILAVACGSIGVQAQTLTLAYHKGDTYRYAIHLTAKESITYGGMAIPVNVDGSGKETVNVEAVDSKGVADVTIALSDLTLKTSANGVTNTTTGSPAPSVSMKIAPDGRVISVNGSSLSTGSLAALSGVGSGSFITAVLSDNAVKPGDSWSKGYDQTSPTGGGTIHIDTKSTYLRNESVAGVNAAVVETKSTTTFKLSIATGQMAGGTSPFPMLPSGSGLQSIAVDGTYTSDATAWIDPSAHRVVKSHMTGSTDATLTFNMAQGSTMPGLTGPLAVKGTQSMDLNPA